MRLIDADALCMHLSDWQFGSMTDGKHDAEYEVINKVIDGIEKEQTVSLSIVQCKDCRYFDLDHFENVRGIPLIVAHEICNRWGNGCKTDSNGFCFMGERRSE